MLNMVKTSYDKSNDRYTFFGMFGVYFTGFIRNNILSEGKMKKLFITISNNVITIDSFFLIELREILLEIMEKQDKYTYSVNVKTIKNLIKELETNTWLNNDTEHVFKLDRQHMKDVLDVNPKEFQEPVYDQYEYKKNVLKNKGLLLDMGTGTGKTYTSISTMIGAKVDIQIYIVMNKNLDTVWFNTLGNNSDGFFKEKIDRKNILTSYDYNNSKVYKDENIILFHYEALDKLLDLVKYFKGKKVGIVVDEVHNFTSQNNRYENLLELCLETESEDIILMSGTPIKGSSLEFITYLEILSKGFNPKVKKRYKELYSSPNYILKRSMQIRYQSTSVKIKKEVLDLPDVEYRTIDVTLLNGNYYTLTNVKKLMKAYLENRMQEIEDNIDTYYDNYKELLEKAIKINPRADWSKYYINFEKIKKIYKDNQLMFNLDLMREINEFEKINIIDLLTSEEKKTFKECAIILKYPLLKVRGEVLGNVVLKMRIECHREMASVINYENIINSTLGKTIIMSGYIDIVKEAENKVKEKGFKPIGVYGNETKNINSLIDKFINIEDANPLVGTYPSISTGHHLVVANIVLLLDLPFRTYLLDQAIARVNRMGQTRHVTAIYTKLLTGEEYNLNSRNIDILKWTREAIEEITGHPVVGMDFEMGQNLDTVSNEDLLSQYGFENDDLVIMPEYNDYYTIKDESIMNDNLVTSMEDFNNELKQIDITYRANAIANEGILESFDSIGNYFSKGLSSITTMFKKLEETSNSLTKDNIFNKDVKDLVNDLNKLDVDTSKAANIYTTIGNAKVPVVMGCKTDIKTTLENISPSLHKIEENIIDILDDAILFINRLMGSEEYRIASRYTGFKVKHIEAYDINKPIYDCIDENGTSDRKAIKDLIPNFNTLFTCRDLVIKNEKVLDVDLLKQIKDKTIKLSKNANDLYDFITDNGDQSVNKAMISELAYRLENTATYVNNASSVIYLYKQTIYSMKEIVKLAEKVK